MAPGSRDFKTGRYSSQRGFNDFKVKLKGGKCPNHKGPSLSASGTAARAHMAQGLQTQSEGRLDQRTSGTFHRPSGCWRSSLGPALPDDTQTRPSEARLRDGRGHTHWIFLNTGTLTLWGEKSSVVWTLPQWSGKRCEDGDPAPRQVLRERLFRLLGDLVVEAAHAGKLQAAEGIRAMVRLPAPHRLQLGHSPASPTITVRLCKIQ